MALELELELPELEPEPEPPGQPEPPPLAAFVLASVSKQKLPQDLDLPPTRTAPDSS